MSHHDADHPHASDERGNYEPPTLTLIGSIEELTLSTSGYLATNRTGAALWAALVLRPGSLARPGGCKAAPDRRPRSHRYACISTLPASLPGLLFARQDHHDTSGTEH